MDNKRLTNFIGGGFWQLNKQMVKAFGLQKSLWLVNLYDHRMMLVDNNNIGEDDFFYITKDKIHRDTGIKPDTQLIYMKEFVELGVLSIKRSGLPARNHYRIDSERLVELVYDRNNIANKPNDIQDPGVQGELDTQDTTIQGELDTAKGVREIKNKETNTILSISSKEDMGDDVAQHNPNPVRIKRDTAKSALLPYDYVYDRGVRDVLDYWNRLPKPIHHHNVTIKSNACQRAIENIKWLLHVHKVSVQTITEAMDTYHWLLTMPHGKLNTAQQFVNVQLADFIRFSLRTKERGKGSVVLQQIESWFEECLQTRDLLAAKWTKIIKDEHPKLTDRIRKLWIENGGRRGLTSNDENSFRLIAKKWHDYFEETDVPFIMVENSPVASVHHLFKALREEGVDFRTAYPSWLATAKMFEERLPAHWIREGIVQPEGHAEIEDDEDQYEYVDAGDLHGDDQALYEN
jgi:hypothetical protein